MMLVHIGQWEAAERVHNAWLRTLEDGVHTYDIYAEGIGAASQRKEWVPNPARKFEKIEIVGIGLYQKVTAAGYDIVKTETLRTFDGQQGFTLAQGQ
jgi:hypothetical protein